MSLNLASPSSSKHSLDNPIDSILPSIKSTSSLQSVSSLSPPTLLVESTKIQPIPRVRTKDDETLGVSVSVLPLRSHSSASFVHRPSSAKFPRCKSNLGSSPNLVSPVHSSRQVVELQENLKAEKHRADLREMTIISLKNQFSTMLKDNQELKLTNCHLEQFKNAFDKLEDVLRFEKEPSQFAIDPSVIIAKVEQFSNETDNLKIELENMDQFASQLQKELSHEKVLNSGLRDDLEMKNVTLLDSSMVASSSDPASIHEHCLPTLEHPDHLYFAEPVKLSIPNESSTVEGDITDQNTVDRIVECINKLSGSTWTLDMKGISIGVLIGELESAVMQANCDKSQLISGQEKFERLSVENRANRETIARLAAQLQQVEEEKTCHDKIVSSLKDESRKSEIQAKCNEAEVISLKHQIEELIATKSALLQHSNELQKNTEIHQRQIAHISKEKAELEERITAFETSLAPLYDFAGTRDDIQEHILSCIKVNELKTKELEEANNLINELKQNVYELETELNCVNERYNESETSNEKLHRELTFYESQSELIERKETQFSEFCHQLGQAMQLEPGLNFVMEGNIAYDALMARAEQLTRNETEKLNEKSQAIVALRNKLKLTQQQLSNKELQLEVIQRRYQGLEEKNRELQSTEDASKKASEYHQKLAKECAQLRKQALNNRNIMQKLKDELEQTSEIRRENRSMTNEISNLDHQIQQLSLDKKRLHQQLSKMSKEASQIPLKQEVLKTEENARVTEMGREMERMKLETIKTVSALEAMKKRENDLVEIVCSVADLLELPLKTKVKGSKETLIIPTQDDIKSALSDLIDSNRMQQDASRALRESLLDMEKTFRKNVCHTLAYIDEDDVTKTTFSESL